MAHVYILHSSSLHRYYTGSTELTPEERLKMHLDKHYGNSKFTSLASDWIIFHVIQCKSIEQAKAIEQHIKKMKSTVYIKNLKAYPSITAKLKTKYG